MLESIARITPRVYGPRAATKFDVMGIRFMTDGEGEGAGGGEGDGEGDGKEGLGDKGQQALDRMKAEKKAAIDEAKSYKALGLTPDEIKALVDEKNAGKPVDEEAIRKAAAREAETAVTEKFHAKLRASSAREQAAALGFASASDALALIPAASLADVDVTDDEVDADAVKKLLEKLAADKPYLLKPTDNTPDYRQAGAGASGSGTSPDVQPGLPRLRDAYANSSTTTKK